MAHFDEYHSIFLAGIISTFILSQALLVEAIQITVYRVGSEKMSTFSAFSDQAFYQHETQQWLYE